MRIQLEGLEIKEHEEVVSIEPIGPQIVRKKLSCRWRQRLEDETSYWREVVRDKDREILGLEKERNELMGKVYTYRDYANRLFEENEGLKRKLNEAEGERERLARQVSAYFDEKEEEPKEIKFGCRKRSKERKKPGTKRVHKGWYREKPDKVDEVIVVGKSGCYQFGQFEIQPLGEKDRPRALNW